MEGKWLGCFVFACFMSCAFSCTKDELIMLQILTRQGSSAPSELYPTDPNPAAVWRDGLGDLTMLGKFQPYAVGSMLRNRYDYFISSNPREVEVMSSANSACVKSALSTVAALYAPNSEWEVVKDFAWQPISVKYVPEHLDKHFEFPECFEADTEYERITHMTEAQDFLTKFQSMFDYWSIHSGWQIRNWDSASVLYDVLEVEQSYNLTVPMWAKTYREELNYISDKSFHWNLKTKKMNRLRGGPLINLIVDNLKKKSSGGLEEKKVFLYTTHAANLVAFMSGLNIFNDMKPPFSSTLAIELYEHQHEYYIRILYFNSTVPERGPALFYVLYLQGCSEYCPLDYVVDYTRDVIPQDWDAECDQKKDI